MDEIKVLEIAPSGRRVKFEYPSGCSVWEVVANFKIVEELPVIKESTKELE